MSEHNPKDIFGKRWYHCDTYGKKPQRHLTMSKASLGTFLEAALRHNGEIGSFWTMNPKFKTSSVLATVRFKDEDAKAFQEETGFLLSDPPRVSLNCETN
jgi:hypothetical protein